MSEPNWELMLARACAGNGLIAHYQPIVDVVRGSVVGYEALARFVGYPVVSPDAWFAAARAHRRVAELEAAPLSSALTARSSLPPNTFLTVNLGPDVLGTPEVQSVLRTQGSLAGLVIELTEHARVNSYVALEPMLDRLRGDGALLALDDAGTGYAGLCHMLNLRPDFIKLDRAFISGLDRDEAKQALVEMMGALAGRLDAWLLAEGVETRAELDVLARLGVPLVQGYHLAHPAPAWASIDPETALHLVTTAREGVGTTLRSMLDDVVTASSVEQAGIWFELDDVDLVVVLDEDSRPVSTVEPDGLVRSMVQGLRVNMDTSVVDAAHRAVARPAGTRGDPLVCIDNAGRFVGLVRMERVMKSLASSVQQGASAEPV